MRRIYQSFSMFLNRNTGWLIAVAIVFFGLTNLYFLKDNKRITEGIQGTTNNTETIIKDLKRVLCEDIPDEECNLAQAVQELKVFGTEQTFITCKLILGGAVELDTEAVAEIERICNERIQTVQDSGGQTSQSQTNTGTSTQPQSTSPPGQEPRTPPADPPAEQAQEPILPLLPCVTNLKILGRCL